MTEPGHDGGRLEPPRPGRAVPVHLEKVLVGDLGNIRVDARLVGAILTEDGQVGKWLGERGVTLDELSRAFPEAPEE